jgi:protein-S-isoprenylcysteine O-methyltransferase Ste14
LPWPGLARPAGATVVILALVNDIWCVASMARHRTTIRPDRAASSLVTEGPFRWSRNPIYVSHVALTAGLGLAFGSAWVVLLLPALVVGLTKLAIEPEERHLSIKFGSRFAAYVAQTRRWL